MLGRFAFGGGARRVRDTSLATRGPQDLQRNPLTEIPITVDGTPISSRVALGDSNHHAFIKVMQEVVAPAARQTRQAWEGVAGPAVSTNEAFAFHDSLGRRLSDTLVRTSTCRIGGTDYKVTNEMDRALLTGPNSDAGLIRTWEADAANQLHQQGAFASYEAALQWVRDNGEIRKDVQRGVHFHLESAVEITPGQYVTFQVVHTVPGAPAGQVVQMMFAAADVATYFRARNLAMDAKEGLQELSKELNARVKLNAGYNWQLGRPVGGEAWLEGKTMLDLQEEGVQEIFDPKIKWGPLNALRLQQDLKTLTEDWNSLDQDMRALLLTPLLQRYLVGFKLEHPKTESSIVNDFVSGIYKLLIPNEVNMIKDALVKAVREYIETGNWDNVRQIFKFGQRTGVADLDLELEGIAISLKSVFNPEAFEQKIPQEKLRQNQLQEFIFKTLHSLNTNPNRLDRLQNPLAASQFAWEGSSAYKKVPINYRRSSTIPASNAASGTITGPAILLINVQWGGLDNAFLVGETPDIGRIITIMEAIQTALIVNKYDPNTGKIIGHIPFKIRLLTQYHIILIEFDTINDRWQVQVMSRP